MDVTKTPYAEFLEKLVKSVVELKPEKIAVVATMPNGNIMTSVYGDCGPYDMMAMASAIQADAIVEIVMANARDIIAAAEEDEEDENG